MAMVVGQQQIEICLGSVCARGDHHLSGAALRQCEILSGLQLHQGGLSSDND
ncbi:hypothetical protein L5I01_34360 [Gordonia sp. HY442]|uniref:hypothetical protein n=1 Tax=Gordonia zhenghanii TaxID=2911516 RepID=UPI001F2D2111|nr:hypothetical protein [Gordonia zhenghanii]MCF8608449.1 hypothetical protein [Gordonia zhenghanii]